MIYGSEISYTHIKGQRNQYDVYYHGDQIGVIRHTPGTCGTWTFTSSRENCQTYGSTRLQAVEFYIEQFMEGEKAEGA